MKSICVNESSGFDQLERVKSSRSVSAFIHPSCWSRDRLTNMEIICHTKQVHIEVSTQDHMLFGPPIQELLDFRQGRFEFSEFASFVRQVC